MITIGKQFVWGMAPIKPMLPTPPGKVRIRRRAEDFVRVRVRLDDGIHEYLVMDEGANWRISHELASITRIGEKTQRINLK